MLAIRLRRQHLQIFGGPDVDLGAGRRQPAVVSLDRRHRRRPHQRAEPRAPASARGELGDDRVRRRAEIVGHLHGQRAAGRDHRCHAREQRAVIGQPMQRRVAVHEIDGRFRRPRGKVPGDEAQARRIGGRRTCLVEHGRGIVDADDVRLRPALGQQPGHVAGAATEIDDRARRSKVHPRKQVERRAQPRIREFQILLWIPAHDGGPPRRCRYHCRARANTSGVASSSTTRRVT